MFKNKLFVILLLTISVFFTSCFEVIEEITMGKDGTGTMTLTVNFSQSKNRIAAIMLMDSIHGYKVPRKQEIQQEIDKTVAQLSRMPGISNVKSTADFTNFVADIRFSFKDVADVNHLVKALLEQYKVKSTNIPTYNYNKEEARFTRDYSYSNDVKAQFNQLKNRDKEIFSAAAYVSILRFETTITSYSNKLARISKNQQAIIQRLAIPDLINGQANISNQVQLSK
jgi:ribosomal protein L23